MRKPTKYSERTKKERRRKLLRELEAKHSPEKLKKMAGPIPKAIETLSEKVRASVSPRLQDSISTSLDAFRPHAMESHLKRLLIDYKLERHPALASLIAGVRMSGGLPGDEKLLGEELARAVKEGDVELIEEAAKLAKAPLDAERPRIRVLWRAIEMFRESGRETWPTWTDVQESFLDSFGTSKVEGIPHKIEYKEWDRIREGCQLDWLEP